MESLIDAGLIAGVLDVTTTEWADERESDGKAWEHFPQEQARSRAYRWGEDLSAFVFVFGVPLIYKPPPAVSPD